jgi:hypothetical protein
MIAYPVAGKRKSREVCEAFIAGCANERHDNWPAVFYGVDDSNVDIWRSVLAERRPYYYIDNSYFDETRGTHFRVTRNGLQHTGVGKTDCKRFRALNIPIRPWRASGAHVVLCPQSESFMRTLAAWPFTSDWTAVTLEALARFTKRQLRVRSWNRDKTAAAATLDDDLDDAHALVTWSSAAAVTAVLRGVPIICTGPSAAAIMGGDVADIENLPRPALRENWAGVLADQQWTLQEMREGVAWRALR